MAALVLPLGLNGGSAAVAAKLLIWPKTPASVSGTTMDVAIDGRAIGTISNLDRQMMIDLGELAAGMREFKLTAIKGYAIDQAGNAQPVPGKPGTCAGQFVVQPFQTYYFVMVQTPNGTDFQCRIQ